MSEEMNQKCRYLELCAEEAKSKDWASGILFALEYFKSAISKPKIAHWIIISPTNMYCSECNEIEHLDTSRKFCAWCGAMMEGEVQKCKRY